MCWDKHEWTETILNEPVCFFKDVLVLHKDVLQCFGIGDVKLLILETWT